MFIAYLLLLFVLCLLVILVVSHFGFEDQTSVLIVQVPHHCLPLPFQQFPRGHTDDDALKSMFDCNYSMEYFLTRKI